MISDISKLGLETLRSRMQLVPQNPILFEGTIRSNLDPSGIISDSVLWDALKDVGMDVYVSGQSEKLESDISANGSNLSIGMRQLLCLARAIIAKPKILVMVPNDP
jgi:ATP-binding cassette subfamily C (CFTR/MRP) protein 1